MSGQVGIDLSSVLPAYRVRAHVQDLSWKGGKVDFETRMTSRGTGQDFLLNLRSEGAFQARTVMVAPDTPLRSATGLYEFTVTPLGPRITLTGLQAAIGAERFSGQGATQADGKLQIELASNTRVMRVDVALTHP